MREWAKAKNVSKEINLDGDFLKISGLKEEVVEKVPLKAEEVKPEMCHLAGVTLKVMENPLLDNIDLLWKRVGDVFPEYKTTDPDDILKYIGEGLPKRTVKWDGSLLMVDGARTSMKREDVKKAYDGLKAMVSSTKAEKLIANIVVKKLKKLF